MMLWLRSCFALTDRQLDTRHQPSGLNTRFEDDLSFADYVTHTRKMLEKVHAHLDPEEREQVVDGNAPFELQPATDAPAGINKPYRRGVLLIHGLTDSPYFMRHLAAFFQENGFRVMAILLPGHGTQPGDLLNVAWQEWAKAVAFGTDRLAEEVDEIYLAGFSAGGTLSISQSQSDKRVRGLFLYSPALEITPRARWANLHKLYSWLLPAKKWVSICPDKGHYKYESFPKNAAAQMHALTRHLNARLDNMEIDIPVFVAASQDDTTAYTSATLEFMAHARHPASRMVLYTSSPDIIPGGIPVEKLEQVNSVIPELKILSASHMSIIMAPEDRYYGMNGTYVSATHYYPDDMLKYAACNDDRKHVFLGEITEKDLAAGILCRLMYNPNYAALRRSMKRFIEHLP